MKLYFTAGNIISSLFGVIALLAGVINTIWGNDMEFGIFIILLSFAFLLPVKTIFQKITGIKLHPAILPVARVVIGIFILWTTLGVGELFDKIDMMMADINTIRS